MSVRLYHEPVGCRNTNSCGQGAGFAWEALAVRERSMASFE
jgi:hypothetical protein